MFVHRWEARDDVRPAQRRNARKCGVWVDEDRGGGPGGRER